MRPRGCISIKDGAVEQSNFYDYALPRMNDVPEMHIELIKTDNHPTGAGQGAGVQHAGEIGPRAGAVARIPGEDLTNAFGHDREPP